LYEEEERGDERRDIEVQDGRKVRRLDLQAFELEKGESARLVSKDRREVDASKKVVVLREKK